MRIIIENSTAVDVSSLKDLERFLPKDHRGEVLNYGQGEGLFRIDGNVWGLYVTDNNNYMFQYEEGTVDWADFKKQTEALMNQARLEFGSALQFSVEGCLEHLEPHEKFT